MKRIICVLMATMLLCFTVFSVFAEEALTDTFQIQSEEAPPEKPGEQDGGGGEKPPEKPDDKPGDDSGGGSGGGGSSAPTEYAAVKSYSEDAELSNGTLSSSGTDESAVLVTAGNVLVENMSIDRTSQNSTGGDNASFYGVGATVLATGGTLTVSDSTITSDANGGAGVFSYGNSVVTVNDTTISTTQSASGGIHVAGGGTLYANDVTVTTQGGSSAAIRSDRGGGTMVVKGGTFTSNGSGSPAVYVTADITVSNAKLTATGSEAICIEGKNSLKLNNCKLSGNMKDDSQNETTWTVILYQSMSGDSQVGCSVFSMDGGSLISGNGGLFYTTNTASSFTLKNVSIQSAADSEFFLRVTGNKNQRGWGSSGSNGADCTFTGIQQTMNGNVQWDSISTLTLGLTKGSVLTGAVLDDESCAGNGGDGWCKLTIDSESTWIVTGDSVVSELNNQGTIADADGNSVTILDANGNIVSGGTSLYTITVLTVVSQNVPVSSITLSAEQTSVPYSEGNTNITVNAAVLPENATNQELEWTVSDGSIATASAGIVSFSKAGTVMITASAKDGSGVSGSIELTAYPENVPVSSITLSAEQTSIPYSEGNTNITVNAAVLPENATNQELEWTVSDGSIATVSAGIVSFSKTGTVTVSASAKDGSGVSGSIELTAYPENVPVSSITLSAEQTSIPYSEGNTNITVNAVVLPENATNQELEWTVSDGSIATVSAGIVSFSKTGTVTVTASAKDGSGVSGSIELTAYPENVPVSSITLSAEQTSIPYSEGNTTITVNAAVLPENATNQELEWSVSDGSIASVNGGIVSFSKTGTVVVSASAKDGSGVMAQIELSCVMNYLTGIKLSTDSAVVTLDKGLARVQLAWSFEPADTLYTNVEFTTSSTDIAIVDPNGMIIFTAPGTVTITINSKDVPGITDSIELTCLRLVESISLKAKQTEVPVESFGTETKAIADLVNINVSPKDASNQNLIWSVSSDTAENARIEGDSVVFLKPGKITLIARAEDASGISAEVSFTSYQAEPETPYVEKITLSASATQIAYKEGCKIRLTATVEPAEASAAVKYTSSNTAVATVSSSGKVVFKKVGYVTITATAKDGSGVSASIKLLAGVKQLTSITLSASSKTVTLKEGTATIKLTTKLKPSTTLYTGVKYYSSDKSIASVTSAGKVVFKKAGTVTITVKSTQVDDVKATIQLTAKNPDVKITGFTVLNAKNKNEIKLYDSVKEAKVSLAMKKGATVELYCTKYQPSAVSKLGIKFELEDGTNLKLSLTEEADGQHVEITANKKGTAIVAVYPVNNTEFVRYFKIKVK